MIDPLQRAVDLDAQAGEGGRQVLLELGDLGAESLDRIE
jgi:hypothetical protein